MIRLRPIHAMKSRRRSIVASLTTTVLLLGCGSSGDTGSGGSISTTPGGSSSGTDSTTSSTPQRGNLEGSWTADADTILGANTANLGGSGGVSCSGPIVMTFNEDGSFDRSGDMTCSVGGVSATGRIASTGQWSATDAAITISGAMSSGTMNLRGTAIPLADAFGDGTAGYTINGDVLEVRFTGAGVGTILQEYTRV